MVCDFVGAGGGGVGGVLVGHSSGMGAVPGVVYAGQKDWVPTSVSGGLGEAKLPYRSD